MTYIAISSDNLELLEKLSNANEFIKGALSSYRGRMSITKVSKDEIDPGIKLPRIRAIHPLTGNKVPVFVANYF